MKTRKSVLIIDSNLGYNIYPAKVLSEYYDVYYYIYHGETLPKDETYLLGKNIVNRIYSLNFNRYYDIVMLMDSSIQISGLESIGNTCFGYSISYDVRNYEWYRDELKHTLEKLLDRYMIEDIQIPEYHLLISKKDIDKLLEKNKNKKWIIKPSINIRFESFTIKYGYSAEIKKKLEKLEWILKSLDEPFYVEEYIEDLDEIGGETIILNGMPCGIYLIGKEGNEKIGYITTSDVLINHYFTRLSQDLFPVNFNGIVSVEGGIDKLGNFWIFEMNIRPSQPTSLIWFKEFGDIFDINKIKSKFNGKKKIKSYHYRQVINEKIRFYDTLTLDRAEIYDKIPSTLLPQSYFKDDKGRYVFVGKRIGLEKVK